METTKRNTYYYNSPKGVTPADHDVKYDYCKTVSDADLGDYDVAEARLEIKNAKTVAEYLDDIAGHYVEGVKSWDDAHEYLIDLVQGMVEELVRNTPTFNDIKEFNAVIEEEYADGYVVYSASVWMDKFDQQLYIDCSKNLIDHVASREALNQMIQITAEELAK